jgi:hypothetical protein
MRGGKAERGIFRFQISDLASLSLPSSVFLFFALVWPSFSLKKSALTRVPKSSILPASRIYPRGWVCIGVFRLRAKTLRTTKLSPWHGCRAARFG